MQAWACASTHAQAQVGTQASERTCAHMCPHMRSPHVWAHRDACALTFLSANLVFAQKLNPTTRSRQAEGLEAPSRGIQLLSKGA